MSETVEPVSVEDDVETQEAGAGMELVLLPPTGEVVDPKDTLACFRALRDLRAMEARILDAKRALGEAIADHRRVTGESTFRLSDGTKVTVTGGPASKLVIDPVELADGLRKAGMPEERVDAIVQSETTYKVDARAAQAAAKANPDYAAAFGRAAKRVDQPWSVAESR